MIFLPTALIPFPFLLQLFPVGIPFFIPLRRTRTGSLGSQSGAAEGRKGDDEN